ncbi:hypothetical protein H5410_036657 [Solanum commersonii]|uniref:Uncharacterized protein n=1 Tax=Solanum commersonii TaxID=4109 RepID=A0A9J5Y4W7_SOLCO|nr:hypothetical protein H5410_036657 [Solanum commersonii]
MESEEDESTHQNPKQSKAINHLQFSSTSMQDSTSTIPNLPEELITEILKRVLVKFLFCSGILKLDLEEGDSSMEFLDWKNLGKPWVEDFSLYF